MARPSELVSIDSLVAEFAAADKSMPLCLKTLADESSQTFGHALKRCNNNAEHAVGWLLLQAVCSDFPPEVAQTTRPDARKWFELSDMARVHRTLEFLVEHKIPRDNVLMKALLAYVILRETPVGEFKDNRDDADDDSDALDKPTLKRGADDTAYLYNRKKPTPELGKKKTAAKRTEKQQRQKGAPASIGSAYLCLGCRTRAPSVAAKACGHVCLCDQCIADFAGCPYAKCFTPFAGWQPLIYGGIPAHLVRSAAAAARSSSADAMP
jgi:hypothetical protein